MYFVDVLADGLVANDPDDWQYWVVVWIRQLIQTSIAAWIIGSMLSRMRRGSKKVLQLTQVETMAYITAYWWSFSLITTGWETFGRIDRHHWFGAGSISGLGFGLWWLLLIVLCVIVFVLGRLFLAPPEYDFNLPPRMYRGWRTALLMLGWGVTFVTWWAWAEVSHPESHSGSLRCTLTSQCRPARCHLPASCLLGCFESWN